MNYNNSKIQTDLTPEQAAIVAQIITQYLEEDKPYLADLENLLKDIQNGTVVVTFRVYNGKVTDLITGEIVKRKTYK